MKQETEIRREAKGGIEILKSVHICLGYECGRVGKHKLIILKSPSGLLLQRLRVLD